MRMQYPSLLILPFENYLDKEINSINFLNNNGINLFDLIDICFYIRNSFLDSRINLLDYRPNFVNKLAEEISVSLDFNSYNNPRIVISEILNFTILTYSYIEALLKRLIQDEDTFQFKVYKWSGKDLVLSLEKL